MGVLTDPAILARFKKALSLWNFSGYINWKGTARQFVEKELQGYTTKLIGNLMYQHVCGGGKIYQITETRPEWLEWRFHYDLYVFAGKRKIYLETVLVDDDPEDSTITVVSAHDPS